MFATSYFGDIYIQLWELMALPFYLLFIYFVAKQIKQKRIAKNPLYEYYVRGLFVKIIGGIAFVLIYMFYWHGADTTAYFESSMAMNNLLMSNPANYFAAEFGGATWEHFSLFSMDTGFPLAYLYFNPQTDMVIRLVNPLLLLTFSSYLLTTVLLDWIAYAGIWRLFLVFAANYPKRKNLFAIAILFFPSVVFWGSGILKDTVTLSCTGWVVYAIYKAIILKENRISNLFAMSICGLLILFIKPYILIALLPGTLIWMLSSRILAIRNGLIRFLIIPFVLFTSIGGGFYLLSNLGSYMGKFSLDKVATTLLVTQSDLKRDYYHGHSFDIGLTDPSPSGLIKKFPEAFVAGMYRPFLWESENAVMLISGLENTLIILLTIATIFRTSPASFFKKLIREPLLFFSLTFSTFFAFSVGISTSNFGALVRFKIAYLPFFLCALFILVKRKDEDKELAIEESRR